MTKQNFEPIVLTDKQDVEKLKREAEIVINHLERARNMYIDFFGMFDIYFFNMIYTNRKPHLLYKDVVRKYIQVNEIDLRGIKLDKALQIGLLDLPDLQGLITSITDVQRQNNLGRFITKKDLVEIYSTEEERFLSPFEPESVVGQKIEAALKFETETEEENEYMNQVKSFAEMYVKLMNEHQTINTREKVPGELFKLKENTDGSFGFYLTQKTLRNYRELKELQKSKVSSFVY